MLARRVERARGGDPRAARKLYDDHIAMVYGTCVAFCRGDTVTASELTQESFARAFEHLGELREPDRFSGWLQAITRRCCLRWAEGRRQEREALEALSREPTAVPRREDAVAEIVAEVIEACPDPALRQTATLFYRPPPHTTAEIAEQLGLSQTAVTTRLHRFRTWAKRRMLRRLANALEEAG